MSVEIYIDHFSQPSRALHAFCEETGIPYSIRQVRLAKGEQNSQEYLKICPWGTVPALTHNSISLYESHAILCYLADAFSISDNWYPKDLIKRAKLNTYLHWHHENIRKNFAGYVFNNFIGPRFYGISRNEELNAGFIAGQAMVLSYLNEVLANGFVAGTQEISIADLVCYCEISQTFIMGCKYNDYPNVDKWLKLMGNRKGIKEAHKVFNALLPKIKL